jgi:hypothetical protein
LSEPRELGHLLSNGRIGLDAAFDRAALLSRELAVQQPADVLVRKRDLG